MGQLSVEQIQNNETIEHMGIGWEDQTTSESWSSVGSAEESRGKIAEVPHPQFYQKLAQDRSWKPELRWDEGQVIQRDSKLLADV
jgi:hypothetical protein